MTGLAAGHSWRIGVDQAETTELVTGGPFRRVRNPIFTAMMMIQTGTAVMAPTWPSLIGAALMITACQIQTRLVEEPYLLRRHGTNYRAYAATTGRFLPASDAFPPPRPCPNLTKDDHDRVDLSLSHAPAAGPAGTAAASS